MIEELAWLELISSASLTVMGLTVSVVAAVFTYRNNFGWAPLALITSIGLSSGRKYPGKYNATVDIEVWNRRKYPIIVRCISIKIVGLEIISDTQNFDEWWLYSSSELISDNEHTISPQSHERREIVAPFAASSLDALQCPIIVEVVLFDPRLNRTLKIGARGTYSFNAARDQSSKMPSWLQSLST